MAVFTNFIENIQHYYQIADCYLFPVFRATSAIDAPLSVLEAMACNLPIVSVPVGDVPEVIDGTDGCYLCNQEPADAAEKLHLALSYEKQTNGREKIRYLDQSNIAKRIITLYNGLLQEKNRKAKHSTISNGQDG